MARTKFKYSYNDFESTDRAIKDVLVRNGYREKYYNGEVVYNKGGGFFTAARYVKIEYSEKEVMVSGWIGGLNKELDLNGIYGSIPKHQVLNVIEQIKINIR